MKIEVYTDGSCEVPKKPCGLGWVIVCDGVKTSEGFGRHPTGTCNDAEFRAAINGLQEALKIYKPGDEVVLRSDSRITLGWASGVYKFKHEERYSHFEILKALMSACSATTLWVRAHSGNEHNERSDQLAHFGRTGSWE